MLGTETIPQHPRNAQGFINILHSQQEMTLWVRIDVQLSTPSPQSPLCFLSKIIPENFQHVRSHPELCESRVAIINISFNNRRLSYQWVFRRSQGTACQDGSRWIMELTGLKVPDRNHVTFLNKMLQKWTWPDEIASITITFSKSKLFL